MRLDVPNVVARFVLEEGDEAVFDEGARRADNHIHNDGNFEVVDANGDPREPRWKY